MPGSFLEQNLACHTGGKGIIHHVTTMGAGKKKRFSCLDSRVAGFPYVGVQSGSLTVNEAI